MRHKWNYLVHIFDNVSGVIVQTTLDSVHREGWKLVSVTSSPFTLYFKRKKQHDS